MEFASEKVTRHDPKELKLAREALDAGQTAVAKAKFEELVQKGVDRPAALLGLSQTYFKKGEFKEAASIPRRAIEAGAGIEAKVAYADACYRDNRLSEAIAMYRAVLKAKPGHARATANLEAALRQAGAN
jgi:tetratricopeptide (TPR) repeat protein